MVGPVGIRSNCWTLYQHLSPCPQKDIYLDKVVDQAWPNEKPKLEGQALSISLSRSSSSISNTSPDLHDGHSFENIEHWLQNTHVLCSVNEQAHRPDRTGPRKK
jgi:hypothetical protein